MSGGAPGLEAIEAMIWRTGTRDRVAVQRIVAAVSAYARAKDCPPDPAARRQVLDAALPVMEPKMPAGVPVFSVQTLAEVLGFDDERPWWPA